MLRPLCAALLVATNAIGTAAPAETLAWGDLVDKAAQVYEDPFLDLTEAQFLALATVIQSREQIERGDSSQNLVELKSRLANAETELAADGVDVEGLIAQRFVVLEHRHKAATSTNPALDGTDVTLAGYAIPANPDPDGTAVVYLVPEPGMCSHVPPPNPNQMIRVRLPGDWYPDRMHAPVIVTGRLEIEPTQHKVMVVDGLMTLQAAYTLQARLTEPLAQSGAKTTSGHAWAGNLADRLRSAAPRPKTDIGGSR